MFSDVIVCTELAENEGPSITNAAAEVWQTVATIIPCGLEDYFLFEHYDRGSYVATVDIPDDANRVDCVMFDTMTRRGPGRYELSGVRWSPMPDVFDWVREAVSTA